MATGASGAIPGAQRLEFERVGCSGPASQVMVPIDQIVGTAEPRTCVDRHVRPTCEVPRARFEWLAAAALSGRGMEPVELYHCGGRYYVLDGNHRIAVARALGERSVCANVTEVRPSDTRDSGGGLSNPPPPPLRIADSSTCGPRPRSARGIAGPAVRPCFLPLQRPPPA
jgi:hypothetical protein